jgi:hypothetical protein
MPGAVAANAHLLLTACGWLGCTRRYTPGGARKYRIWGANAESGINYMSGFNEGVGGAYHSSWVTSGTVAKLLPDTWLLAVDQVRGHGEGHRQNLSWTMPRNRGLQRAAHSCLSVKVTALCHTTAGQPVPWQPQGHERSRQPWRNQPHQIVHLDHQCRPQPHQQHCPAERLGLRCGADLRLHAEAERVLGCGILAQPGALQLRCAAAPCTRLCFATVHATALSSLLLAAKPQCSVVVARRCCYHSADWCTRRFLHHLIWQVYCVVPNITAPPPPPAPPSCGWLTRGCVSMPTSLPAACSAGLAAVANAARQCLRRLWVLLVPMQAHPPPTPPSSVMQPPRAASRSRRRRHCSSTQPAASRVTSGCRALLRNRSLWKRGWV